MYQIDNINTYGVTKVTKKQLEGPFKTFEKTSSIQIQMNTERCQWVDVLIKDRKSMPGLSLVHDMNTLKSGKKYYS